MNKTFLTASVCAILAIASSSFAQDTQTAKKYGPRDMNVPQDMKVANLEQKSQKRPQQASKIDAKEQSNHAEIEKNAACQNILNECKKLGFVAGGFKEGKGLWKNCFAPVVHGKSATLQGKEVSVAVNANDVSSCKTTVKEVHKEEKPMKGEKDHVQKRKIEKAADTTSATAKQ